MPSQPRQVRIIHSLFATLLGVLGLFATLAGARAVAQQNAGPTAAQTAETEPQDETGDQSAGGPERKQQPSLPKLADMPLPTAEELLHGQKLDWVVLKGDNEHVIVTEPVLPRPDTLNQMAVAIEEKYKQRQSSTAEAREQFRRELEDLANIRIQRPEQYDETEYQLHMNRVAQIIHHEDLMLRRIDVLIGQQNFELGYELLNVLRRGTPDWPGAARRHSQFLIAEADRRIARGEFQSGLATLEEVYERNPTFNGLTESVGGVIDRLIGDAVDMRDWRRARHFLNRLSRMYAEHPSALRWESELAGRAEQALQRADQARNQGHHEVAALSAETATQIWPRTRNLRTRHRIYADRFQRLHVGVLDLPTPGFGDPVLGTRADRRLAQLQSLKFFHVDNADDGSAHYSSRFCDRWEPLNLGREAVFELRSSRQPWEMQPIVTAPAIAARLTQRLNPNSPSYDERLAGYASLIEITSPYSLRVQFRRVPVRTEALLTIAVEPAAVPEGQLFSDAGESPVALNAPLPPQGGFELAEMTEQRAVYRRSMPEPEGLRLYHLTEIQEHRFQTFDDAMQALLRGDISLLPDLPARHVQRLRSDDALLKSLFVEKMALPLTHVVQLHPGSRPLKNREYRRALMYAIDRETLLSETVLAGAPSDLGRVVTGPFPSESYANSALAFPREYDPVSAISLTLAARKQLGGTLPPLRMVVVDEPIVQAAAQRLVETWKRFGIDVTIIPPPARLVDPDRLAAEWDLLYRTVQMVEPVVDLWPFLTLTGRAQVSDLDEFPDWLRQEIINLDLIGDWSAAVQATKRLHRHLWSEVMVIPLWEVDQYLVYRKNIRGVPVSPVQVYDEIDRWVVEAWYPIEEP